MGLSAASAVARLVPGPPAIDCVVRRALRACRIEPGVQRSPPVTPLALSVCCVESLPPLISDTPAHTTDHDHIYCQMWISWRYASGSMAGSFVMIPLLRRSTSILAMAAPLRCHQLWSVAYPCCSNSSAFARPTARPLHTDLLAWHGRPTCQRAGRRVVASGDCPSLRTFHSALNPHGPPYHHSALPHRYTVISLTFIAYEETPAYRGWRANCPPTGLRAPYLSPLFGWYAVTLHALGSEALHLDAMTWTWLTAC